MVANQKHEKPWKCEMRDGEPVFLCKFPGCTFESHHPGGVELHTMKKHGPNASRKPAATGTNRNEQRHDVGTKRTPQPTAHRHSWRLLKLSNLGERAAKEAGYHEVCEECEELR